MGKGWKNGEMALLGFTSFCQGRKKDPLFLVSLLVSLGVKVRSAFLKCPSLLTFTQIWSLICGPDGQFEPYPNLSKTYETLEYKGFIFIFFLSKHT
jgi:hypothetical protein